MRLFLVFFLFISSILSAQQDTVNIRAKLIRANELHTKAPQKADSIYKQLTKSTDSTLYPKIHYEILLGWTTLKYHEGDYKTGIKILERNLRKLQKIDLPGQKNKTYYHLGLFHQLQGDYSISTENYLKAISLAEERKDTSLQLLALNNLSNIQKDIRLLEKAKANYKKIIPLAEQSANIELLAMSLLNLQDINTEQENFGEAKKYGNQYTTIQDKLNSNRLQYHYHKNLSEWHRQSPQGNWKDEEKHALLAHAFILKEDVPYETAYATAVLGQVYRNKNKAKAITYLNQSLLLSKKINAKNIAINAHYELQQIYADNNDFKNAYKHALNYISLNDSIIGEKNRELISTLTTQYETEKKNLEINEQQLTIQQQQNKLLKEKQRSSIAITSGLFLVLITIGAGLFFRQKHLLNIQKIQGLEQQREITELESVIKGEEKERLRIANDLHDGINGDLSALKFQLSSLQLESFTTAQQTKYDKTMEMIDQSISAIRTIAHNLSPSVISQFGLIEAVRLFCNKLDKSSSLTIIFQWFGSPLPIPNEKETMIYRIVQELCQNIIKHAQATEALVQFNFDTNTLHITVEDNGIGFSTKEHTKGMGLKNIRSRTQFLNAQIEIDSNSYGSAFHLEIPLNQKHKV